MSNAETARAIMRQSEKPPTNVAEAKARIQQAKTHVDYLTTMATAAVGGTGDAARLRRSEILSRRLMLDAVLTWMPPLLDMFQHDLILAQRLYSEKHIAGLRLVDAIHNFLTDMQTYPLPHEAKEKLDAQVKTFADLLAANAPDGVDAAIAQLGASV